MPLPTGKWKINVNGNEQDFTIHSPEGGIFQAQYSDLIVKGLWDEVSQTVTFALYQVQGPVAVQGEGSVAVFKGYLFRTPQNPEPGRDVVVTLAGFVQSTGAWPSFVGSTSRRNVFGWYAQITEVV